MVEIEGMEFPLDRMYYGEDGAHLWLKAEGEVVKVGMDAFASQKFGDFQFLSVERKRTRAGEAIGSFESAKFVSQLRSPLDGEVVETNESVVENPKLINQNPYNSWILAIKPETSIADIHFLSEEAEIREWIASEVKNQEG